MTKLEELRAAWEDADAAFSAACDAVDAACDDYDIDRADAAYDAVNAAEAACLVAWGAYSAVLWIQENSDVTFADYCKELMKHKGGSDD